MEKSSEIDKQNFDIETKINLYLEQLTDDEKIVLEIAKQQLKSSFNLKKSIVFIEFCKNNNF